MVRARIRGHLATWMFAVEAQGKRVLEPEPQELQEANAYLFIVALRQLLRCIDWAITNADTHGDGSRSKALRAAFANFDAAVPNAKDVRDIIEHFDDYERGRGDLQKKGEPALILMYEDDGSSFQLTLMRGYTINVTKAAVAAEALANRCMDELDGPS